MTYEQLMKAYKELQQQNANQTKKIEELETTILNLTQQINVLQRYTFGSKREKTPEPEDDNQISMFETEEEIEQNVMEQLEEQVEEIIVHRKKNTKKVQAGIKKSKLKEIVIDRKEYLIDTKKYCADCDGELELVAKKIVRQEITFTPATLTIDVYVQGVYKCNKDCNDKNNKENKSSFVKSDVPKALIPRSFASPSLATEVIYNKYYLGVPLFRQEKMWNDKGLVLPRAMMANWCIKLNEYYLEYLWKLMLKKMKTKCEVLQADETTIQCNKEPGRKATSTSYMWVLRSGELEKHKGVVFKYSTSRSSETAKEFLGGYKGILVTDRICLI